MDHSGTKTLTQEEIFFRDLKHSTRAAHENLEKTPMSAALMAPYVSLNDYAFYLASMQKVILFFETKVFPRLSDVVPDIDERRKLSSINADVLQLSKEKSLTFQLPEFNPGEPADTATALGFLYVIEGSTLGGRVILKHLMEKAILDDSYSLSFFEGYREKTGVYWKVFLSSMSNYVLKHNCQAETIAGAQQGFQSIHDYFQSLSR